VCGGSGVSASSTPLCCPSVTMDTIQSHPGNAGARLTPKQSAILCSCAGGAVYGLSAGIIGGVNDAIIKDRYFKEDTDSVQAALGGTLVACLLVGAFIGCFLGVYSGNRFGHRVSFRIAALNCIVMSVLLAVLPGFPLLVIARTLLGISVGFATALVPWYVNDSVDAAVSGSIGTIYQINICGFILVAEIINYVCHPDASKTNVHITEWIWRVQLACSAAPGLALFLLSYIMHECPTFLKGLADRERLVDNGGLTPVASAALSDDAELNHSANGGALVSRDGVSVPVEAKAGMRELFKSENLKYVAIALILSSSQQLTGINAIIFYAPGIFKDANMANPLVLTLAVVGTWNLVSVFISFALVDRLGRRVLMLSALAIMGLGAGLMALAYEVWPEHKGPPAILALLLFVGAFECGPGPLFFVMAVESFPARLRDSAMSLAQSSCWVFSILITFGFPVLNEGLGSAATFLIFFIMCTLSLVLIWWRIPEPVRGAKDSAVEVSRSRSGSEANGAAYQKLEL